MITSLTAIFLFFADVDFNATVQSVTLSPEASRTEDLTLFVDIFDDTVSEREEQFIILLRVTNRSTDIQLNRDKLIIVIRMDTADGK